ncbi:MarC family protein [Prosthecomicrobium sp. N25]|uniref:MarC family protein n=1 Tax=Prosthecomicrobium sp. N25 TaxID=3129254 RepID=UPI0030785578
MGDYILNAFVTLFVTVDPPGLAPIFVAVTARMTSDDRRHVAWRATVIAGLVLLAFALFGASVLGALGISIPAFRIAGGLLLFYIAFEMVFARRSERKSETAGRTLSAEEARHLAVFPVAIPLIAGPGAISATILAASQAPTTAALVVFLVIIVAVTASCLAVFLLADPLNRALGETGRVVVERLLGLILAALAVQFVADGIKAIAIM